MAVGVYRIPKKPRGPFLHKKIVTKRPTTTGGRPMPVLIRLTTILFPINLERATATPTDIPIKRLTRVAIPETSSDRRVIPMTSGSRVMRSQKAFLIPSKIRSIESSGELMKVPHAKVQILKVFISTFDIHLTFACLREAASAKAGNLKFEL
jgi:hypothetical protein